MTHIHTHTPVKHTHMKHTHKHTHVKHTHTHTHVKHTHTHIHTQTHTQVEQVVPVAHIRALRALIIARTSAVWSMPSLTPLHIPHHTHTPLRLMWSHLMKQAGTCHANIDAPAADALSLMSGLVGTLSHLEKPACVRQQTHTHTHTTTHTQSSHDNPAAANTIPQNHTQTHTYTHDIFSKRSATQVVAQLVRRLSGVRLPRPGEGRRTTLMLSNCWCGTGWQASTHHEDGTLTPWLDSTPEFALVSGCVPLSMPAASQAHQGKLFTLAVDVPLIMCLHAELKQKLGVSIEPTELNSCAEGIELLQGGGCSMTANLIKRAKEALAEGRVSDAYSLAASAEALSPSLASVRQLMGVTLMVVGDNEAALDQFEESLRLLNTQAILPLDIFEPLRFH
eukprot:GHVR01019699.1.p1 GENE.GHVR01019699.1~~GHVR01019699.1.p1  ORF type:complete len:393 (+),score=175.35 GHVR01019699.1:74-1252(+)